MKRSILWKVYGYGDSDQQLSYEPSVHNDFSTRNETRIIDVKAFDKTGSHKYVEVEITCDTYDACYREFNGQLTDGLFENYDYGKIEEIGSSFTAVFNDNNPGEKFRDVWDNIAAITNEGDKYRVKIYDDYNNELLSKLYKTRKGAKIAIKKLLSESWEIQ